MRVGCVTVEVVMECALAWWSDCRVVRITAVSGADVGSWIRSVGVWAGSRRECTVCPTGTTRSEPPEGVQAQLGGIRPGVRHEQSRIHQLAVPHRFRPGSARTSFRKSESPEK